MSEISISTNSTPRWTLTQLIDAAAPIDAINGVGIWREHFSEMQPSIARKLLDDAHLRCSGIYYAGNYTLGVDAAVEDAKLAIDQAVTLGAPQILFLSGPCLKGMSLAEATAMAIDGLRKTASLAGDAGIKISVEGLHPVMIGKYGVFGTIGQAVDAVRGINHATVCVDTWNCWWQPDLMEAIAGALPTLGWVHVCDWLGGENPSVDPMDRVVPGDGIAPLQAMLDGLRAGGFDGWFDIELMQASPMYSPSVYPEIIRRSAETVRQMLGQPPLRAD